MGTPNELTRLLHQPRRWSKLNEDEFIELLQSACLLWALHRADSDLESLNRLYEFAINNAAPTSRLRAAIGLAEMLDMIGREQRATPVSALEPFLLSDPNFTVISTAALRCAQLMSVEHDDPMTGPRRVLALARSCEDSARHTAFLTGLAALGDRRVFDLIESEWDHVEGDTAADVVAALGRLPPTLAVIEFLVTRLERWVSEGHEGPIGHVVPALNALAHRARTAPPPAGVLDIERTFPSWTLRQDRSPVTIHHAYTVEEFGRRIVPRLAALAALERYPRILPQAIRSWGGDDPPFIDSVVRTIEGCASIEEQSSLLAVPLDVDPIPDWSRTDCVLEWGILNPFGPTRVQWCLVPIDARTFALVYTMHHPLSPVSKLVGVVRSNEASKVSLILLDLAKAGSLDDHPLLKGLPHWVRVSGVAARELNGAQFFRTLHLRAIAEGHAHATDLHREIADLKRMRQDAASEVGRQMREAARLATDTLSDVASSGSDEALARLARTRMAVVPSQADEYQRWFDVVSGAEHVAAVAPEFLDCWNAAMRFVHRTLIHERAQDGNGPSRRTAH